MFMRKIRLGASACLLGQKVRYDGQHKLDHYIVDILGQFAEFVPVCPEVECGLPVPREAMHLAGDIDAPRLVTIHTGIDHTGMMNAWMTKKLDELEKEKLCGFIFKSKSPSSGRFNVKVFGGNGIPVKQGVGLFARGFTERFPLIPVEEEGRLNDNALRENFIDKIMVFSRWREYEENDGSAQGLVEFHSRHKYMLMAHSSDSVKELGRIVAAQNRKNLTETKKRYLEALMKALDYKVTPKKNRNVMMHIMGYFKKNLSAYEKQELLDLINGYVDGLFPMLSPLTLLRHYTRKYNSEFLLQQYYLNPSAEELQLKYHV
jgi:uncharacterized protein YbgA (DUF1722 family)/uncharacterized protein YbbK (DUF523 family)